MLWPGVAFKIQEKREESLRAVSGVRTGDSNKAHPPLSSRTALQVGVCPRTALKRGMGALGRCSVGKGTATQAWDPSLDPTHPHKRQVV